MRPFRAEAGRPALVVRRPHACLASTRPGGHGAPVGGYYDPSARSSLDSGLAYTVGKLTASSQEARPVD